MRKDYEKLKEKILKLGTINLTDLELNQLLFLEEDLKEKNAQKKLLQVCGVRTWSQSYRTFIQSRRTKILLLFFEKSLDNLT